MRLSSVMVPLAVLAALAVSHSANAMMWDESLNGDLSNDGLAPTLLTLSPGSNQILGHTGDGGQGVDRDYFTFTLAQGQQLSSIVLLNNTLISDQFSFIGIQAGPQVTILPNGANAEQLLGWTHYSNGDRGFDLLPSMGLSPLSPGTYSAWVQDTGGPATYGFDFNVSSVPLPPAFLLMASSLLGMGIFRRRTAMGG